MSQPQPIVVVKKVAQAPEPRAIIQPQRDMLLRNLDYMEAQIGRLAKMARDMRRELTSKQA